jgi:glycine/D-amino acid oxidase-like deaminating enzyme/nitrite reductase/ring-hydroxylating ferredoxin subunit
MDYDQTHSSGTSVPLWLDRTQPFDSPSPVPEKLVDVAVVGAGIAGLSVAYHVLRTGRSVVVLDKGAVGMGETARSTAHVASALDDHYYLLERIHGQGGAHLAADSHTAAIEDVFAISAAEGIECSARHLDGYLFSYPGDSPRELEQELRAARRAGLQVELVQAAPLPFQTGAALRFARQGEIDPLAYLLGLADAVARAGGVICTGRKVERIEEGKPAIIHLAEGATVRANHVVVATNSPVHDRFALHTKQAAYRTYVVALQVPKGSVMSGLYWDLLDPYHYIRMVGEDTLLVGGEDHKVGQARAPEQRWATLVSWTREHFPMAGDMQAGWSGQVFEPADGLAFIGKNPGRADNVFVATGDSGNGITHGAIAGMLISDLIAGRENPWSKLYDPSRKIVHPQAMREFVHENVNVARQYADWVLPAEQPPTKPGEGAVIRRGAHRIAVYVDDAGARHECSAACPHLGGVVAWNRAEKSWDCPCHGSRFDPYGKVLTGPAVSDLAQLHEEPAETPRAEDGRDDELNMTASEE